MSRTKVVLVALLAFVALWALSGLSASLGDFLRAPETLVRVCVASELACGFFRNGRTWGWLAMFVPALLFTALVIWRNR